MKGHLLLIITILIFSCQNQSVDNQEIPNSNREQENPLAIHDSNNKSEIDTIEMEDLTNTKWIHSPYPEFPECIDTLVLTKDSKGYEYRCEFELASELTYSYVNDTLSLNIYGYISEVDASLGQEIKYRYKYVRINNRLVLVGYEGFDKQLDDSLNYELIYNLVKS